MTVTVTKSEINVRDTLTRLDAPQGVFGTQLAAANTVTEAYTLMNPVMFRNKINNGDFRVWQRGTSITTTSGQYTADQWYIEPRSSQSVTIAQSTDVPLNAGFTYSGRFAATGGSLQGYHIRHGIELPANNSYGEFQPGTTWTLSLWAKSAYTGVVMTPLFFLCNGTGGGANTSVAVNPGGQTVGQSWSKYTWTITIPPYVVDGGSLSATTVFLIRLLVGAGAQDLYITGVQFEKNSQATPYEFLPYSIGLQLCQRYLQRIGGESNSYQNLTTVSYESATTIWGPVYLKTTMRTTPSFTVSGQLSVNTGSAGTVILDTNQSNSHVVTIGAGGTAASSTAGYSSWLRWNPNSGGFVLFSAEL